MGIKTKCLQIKYLELIFVINLSRQELENIQNMNLNEFINLMRFMEGKFYG